MNNVATRVLHDPSLLTHSVLNLHHVFVQSETTQASGGGTSPHRGSPVRSQATVLLAQSFTSATRPTPPSPRPRSPEVVCAGREIQQTRPSACCCLCAARHYIIALHCTTMNLHWSLLLPAPLNALHPRARISMLGVSVLELQRLLVVVTVHAVRRLVHCAMLRLTIASHWSERTDAPNTLTAITNAFPTQCCPVRTIARRLD